MKIGSFRLVMLVPILTALVMGAVMTSVADGATVVVDNSMVTYNPEVPLHSDEFNVTVEPVMIDAEPVEDGVVLWWSLCTDNGCGVAQPLVMTESGNGTWSAVIGPFPEKEQATGLEYKDILFRVKITAVPTEGGDEII